MLIVALAVITLVLLAILGADYESRKAKHLTDKKKVPPLLGDKARRAFGVSATVSAVALLIAMALPNRPKKEGYIPDNSTLTLDSTNLSTEEISLETDIRARVNESGSVFLHSIKEDSGCLWVYILNDGRNKDGLANSVCGVAARYDVKCVSIFDANQKRLGQSMCH